MKTSKVPPSSPPTTPPMIGAISESLLPSVLVPEGPSVGSRQKEIWIIWLMYFASPSLHTHAERGTQWGAVRKETKVFNCVM